MHTMMIYTQNSGLFSLPMLNLNDKNVTKGKSINIVSERDESCTKE